MAITQANGCDEVEALHNLYHGIWVMQRLQLKTLLEQPPSDKEVKCRQIIINLFFLFTEKENDDDNYYML